MNEEEIKEILASFLSWMIETESEYPTDDLGCALTIRRFTDYYMSGDRNEDGDDFDDEDDDLDDDEYGDDDD